MRVFSRVGLLELGIRVFGFPNVQAFGPSAARAFGVEGFRVLLLSVLGHLGVVTWTSGVRVSMSVFGLECSGQVVRVWVFRFGVGARVWAFGFGCSVDSVRVRSKGEGWA